MPLEQKTILQERQRSLMNELLNIHTQITLNESRIEDCRTPTGNAAADAELAKTGLMAANSVVMFCRMKDTRAAALTTCETELAAITEKEKTP